MKIGFSFAKKTEVRKNIGVQLKEVNPDVKTEVIVDIEDGKITSENPVDESPLVIPCSNPLKLKRKRENTEDAADAEALQNKKKKAEELEAKLHGMSAEDREAALALFKASGGDVDDQEDVKPIMMQSKFAGLRSEGGSEKQQLARESALLPESLKDQFDAVPVEQFGMALLRGMGYNPKEDANKPILLERRSGLAGLGATNLLPGEKLKEEPQKKDSTTKKPELPNDGSRIMLGYIKPKTPAVVAVVSPSSDACASKEDTTPVLPPVVSDASPTPATSSTDCLLAPPENKKGNEEEDGAMKMMEEGQQQQHQQRQQKYLLNEEKNSRGTSNAAALAPVSTLAVSNENNASSSSFAAKSSKESSSSSSSWLSRGLLVKMIHEKDEFFKCKAVVLKEERGRVKLKVRRGDGPSELVEDYPAKYLETVISRDATRVRIVQGSFRGEDGKIIKRDAGRCRIVVRINGEEREFDFDEACEYV